MYKFTAVSLIALVTAVLPAHAQTVLYGEQPAPRPAFPQPQPYYVPPQPVPQQAPIPTQPLYYESIPAVQLPPLQQPPLVYEPDQGVRSFQPVPQQGITPTRPLAPVERYQQPVPPAQPPLSRQQQVIVQPPALRADPRQQPQRTGLAPAEPEMRQPSPAVMPEPTVTESDALRDFSQELSRIVSLGERYRAASPGFLEDLKALAEKYSDMPVRVEAPEEAVSAEEPELVGPPPPSASPMDQQTSAEEPETPEQAEIAMVVPPEPEPEPEAEPEPAIVAETATFPLSEPEPEPMPQELPQALPPTTAAVVYLRDDFSDGEYLSNPSWNVRQGQFSVDPAFGLRPFSPEAAEPAQVTPQALLQYLIGDGKPETPEPTGDAAASLIEAQTDIGNAFSLITTITDHGGEGAAHFILHQGGANWLGYRLELRAGPRPLVVLARRGSSGYKDIMKVEAPGFTSGKPHQLRWARLADGQMFVLIDGRPIITARDTVFRQGWKGFAYFTADADISMRNIRIAEPVER